MVMLSPALALVTPSPGEVLDLVTPILKAVKEKSRVDGGVVIDVIEGEEKLEMLRERIRELWLIIILVSRSLFPPGARVGIGR
jgi:hypothetical protein